MNTTTAGDQKNADVDMNDAGTIVVGWSSANVAKAQCFDATGTPLGGELTAMDGTLVAVGIDGAGNFVVGGNVVNDVAMQRFAADGTTLGPVMVADFVSNNSRDP